MTPLHDITVLVVDDDRAVRLLIKAILLSAGARVLSAGDGEQALKMLELHLEIDAIVTDIDMPRMSGLDLITQMQSNPLHNQAIVVCSALAAFNERLLAKLGVHHVIDKPFSPATLIDALDAALADHDTPRCASTG